MAYESTLLFLPAVLLLGGASFYTDARYRIIRNRYLLAALAYLLVAYPLLIASSGSLQLNLSLFLLNLFLASAAGYLLYHYNVWAAGDGKLFIIFSLLAPDFSHARLWLLPCMLIFVNANIAALAYLFCESLYRMVRRKTFIDPQSARDIARQVGFSFLIIISISWIVRSAILAFLPHARAFHPFILFAFYAILYRTGSRSPKKIVVLGTLISASLLFRCIYYPQSIFNAALFLTTMLSAFKFAVIFTVIPRMVRIDLGDPASIPKEQLNTAHIPYSPFLFFGTLLSFTPLSTRLILFLFGTLQR